MDFNQIQTLQEGLNAFKQLERDNTNYKAFDALHHVLEKKFNVRLNFYSTQRTAWGKDYYCPKCNSKLGTVKLIYNQFFVTVNGEEYLFEVFEGEDLPLMECSECDWSELNEQISPEYDGDGNIISFCWKGKKIQHKHNGRLLPLQILENKDDYIVYRVFNKTNQLKILN